MEIIFLEPNYKIIRALKKKSIQIFKNTEKGHIVYKLVCQWRSKTKKTTAPNPVYVLLPDV